MASDAASRYPLRPTVTDPPDLWARVSPDVPATFARHTHRSTAMAKGNKRPKKEVKKPKQDKKAPKKAK